jgi:hypothetical protein
MIGDIFTAALVATVLIPVFALAAIGFAGSRK